MLKKGDRAPRFDLDDLGGKRRSLDDILSSGPAVIVFFKISCPVCQLALPFLERIASGGSIPIWGVSQDDARSTQKFNDRFDLTMPSLVDREDAGYKVSNAFDITHVPSVFVIEKDGAISLAFDGFSKRDIAAIGERAGVRVYGEHDNVPEWKAG